MIAQTTWYELSYFAVYVCHSLSSELVMQCLYMENRERNGLFSRARFLYLPSFIHFSWKIHLYDSQVVYVAVQKLGLDHRYI